MHGIFDWKAYERFVLSCLPGHDDTRIALAQAACGLVAEAGEYVTAPNAAAARDEAGDVVFWTTAFARLSEWAASMAMLTGHARQRDRAVITPELFMLHAAQLAGYVEKYDLRHQQAATVDSETIGAGNRALSAMLCQMEHRTGMSIEALATANQRKLERRRAGR